MSRPSDPPFNLPVPVAPAAEAEPKGHVGGPSGRKRADPSFEAHVMGQPGIKRGLKAGAEVLETARAVYLGTEYSGHADRRPKPGIIKKTEV